MSSAPTKPVAGDTFFASIVLPGTVTDPDDQILDIAARDAAAILIGPGARYSWTRDGMETLHHGNYTDVRIRCTYLGREA